jgi:uncharacterized membrane protein
MVDRHGEGNGAGALEGLISYILITGVVISLFLEAAGLVLFYRSSGTLAISHGGRIIIRAEDFFALLGQLFSTASSGWPLRLMTLGIAVLILTPYARALLSVIYFACQRNFKYLAITLFVVIILTVSLLVH